MNLDPYFIPQTKINSQWIIAPNVRAKTIKLSEESRGAGSTGLSSSLNVQE